jgi:hypothetical protein
VVGFWLDTVDEGLVVFKGAGVIAMPLAGCVTGLVIDGVFRGEQGYIGQNVSFCNFSCRFHFFLNFVRVFR